MSKPVYDMCVNPSYYVDVANPVLLGKHSTMKINSVKLIRAAIMQVKPGDEELREYRISIIALSELLGVDSSNLYREIDDITTDIMTHFVYVCSDGDARKHWRKIAWVSSCEYDCRHGVRIRLSDDMREFVLALKDNYSQYPLEQILSMDSVYAIRIFEMLMAKIMVKWIDGTGVHVILTIDEIVDGCGLSDTYRNNVNNIKRRVLDIAVQEINRVTPYDVTYVPIKMCKAIHRF